MNSIIDNEIDRLKKGNNNYINNQINFSNYINGQNPKIAILSCSDSRVIPEYIFDQSIGEIFVIRIAGNIAFDDSIISSLEIAVDHLSVSHLIILGHTNCGAVKLAEQTNEGANALINEIKKSFKYDSNNHIKANIKRQIEMLPKRSKIIKNAINQNKLKLIGAIYRIEDGMVNFID